MMTPEMVLQNIFSNARTFEEASAKANAALGAKLDFLSESFDLTPEQNAKLHTAGRGDIHRFFTDYSSAVVKLNKSGLTQQEYSDFYVGSIYPLQQKYVAGLHNRQSLFDRTIASTLTPQQYEVYLQNDLDRRLLHYRVIIKAMIINLDGQLPMTAKQRAELEEVILSKSTPPENGIPDEMQFQVALYLISKIPEQDLKPIFDDAEWTAFKAFRAQGAHNGIAAQLGLTDE
ncbi:hypothetical protein SH668x_003801 [Planctomicrobium sp. SH668]|uniref:hypothetical protein n=1 Tax=Planctomicrobium sp. SH668 TaxID=3448126 RepID=UPI003F5C5F53